MLIQWWFKLHGAIEAKTKHHWALTYSRCQCFIPTSWNTTRKEWTNKYASLKEWTSKCLSRNWEVSIRKPWTTLSDVLWYCLRSHGDFGLKTNVRAPKSYHNTVKMKMAAELWSNYWDFSGSLDEQKSRNKRFESQAQSSQPKIHVNDLALVSWPFYVFSLFKCKTN